MYAKADVKHTVALIGIAIGAIALLIGGCTAYVAATSDKPGWFGCTAVCGLFGIYMIYRGLKLRNSAVAAGSSLIETMEQASAGATTRTETRKPTFLRKKEEAEDVDEDDEH